MAALSKFTILSEHEPIPLQLASAAERAFSKNPLRMLIRLTQLGKALALCSRRRLRPVQRNWLVRLAYQLIHQVMVDRFSLGKRRPGIVPIN